jgi:hypothetical protein
VPDDAVAEIEEAAEQPVAAKADDDFDDMLEALDLEPENIDETQPPKTDDPPEAEPDDPFAFLKK